jgi:hypothetical protein
VVGPSWKRFQKNNRRRWTNASGGKGVMRQAHHSGTKLITIFVQINQHRLNLTQVPHQVWPGNVGILLLQALLQVFLQAESQEAGDAIPDRSINPMMIDRPDFQGGFLFPKGFFHPPQAFIGLGHLGRRQIGHSLPKLHV